MKKDAAKWILIWSCWTFVALFFTSEVIFRGGSVFSISAWELLLRELINNYIWFGLTPIVIWLAGRVPIENRNWKRGLIFHLAAGVFLALFHVAVYTFVLHFTSLAVVQSSYWERFQNLLTFNFHSNIAIYWIVFGIVYAIDSYRRQREKDVRNAQLEARLALAQLQALKMQLHPHFLFNTLNTISVLMETDAKSANRMLVGLSELLRIALDDNERQEVSLRQELDFLERYLKIEQMRFEERLKVEMNIAPETLDAVVPNLILQPLVENAVRHGIAPNISGGTIEIGAERDDGMLRLFVRDTGEGNAVENLQEGIGLSNTRARLKRLYDGNHSLQMKTENGFSVFISIPFRTNKDSSFDEK